MTPVKPHVVCLSGSLTPQSRSDRIAAWCAAECAAHGAETTLLSGADLDFPFYRLPDGDRPDRVRRFVDTLRDADAVVAVSPTYHGTISGLLKNAFDYVNDLEAAAQPFLDGRAFGCVAISSGEQGATSTLSTLRTISHALRAWPTPLGVAISGPITWHSDGIAADDRLVAQLRQMIAQVLTIGTLNVRRRHRIAQRQPVQTGPR